MNVSELKSKTETRAADEATPEISVVMPCLNEAETLETCIRKARAWLADNGISGEVVIADNGSTDDSVGIARRAGARVVHVEEKGYGAALQAGFRAARGRFLIMGDADDSYDFSNLRPFVDELRGGAEFVIGERFRGGIVKGAMPWHHRYIGNPLLTGTLNLFFGTHVGDAHCGLRGLTKSAFERMQLRTTGMEFASEMIVKADAKGLKMSEVPTTLSPDGRSRPPHLRSMRDGWRHLRFLMMLSPEWVLMYPGGALFVLGAMMLAVFGLGPLHLGQVVLDHHTMIAGAMLTIVGYQAITIGFAARVYAIQEELGKPSALLQAAQRAITLERALMAGLLLLLVGAGLVARLIYHWVSLGLGPLDLPNTLRPMLMGVTLVAIGSQTMLTALFYGMLDDQRTRRRENETAAT